MKIKIIDLLVKIANGEEVPEKIKYDGIVLIYEVEIQDYWCYYDKYLFEYKFAECNDFLNEYVEIVKEPKKIEKLEPVRGSDLSDLTDKDMILRNNALVELCKTLNNINNKVNELIDEINNLKEK